MHRILSILVLALGLMPAVPARADGPVVVELFTSQGCSACPPADALMVELSQRDDVIALSLHVDYWDYIGWPDTFADAAFTARQHAYARATGSRMVYTPHMVVAGADHIGGYQPMTIADLIADHRARGYPVAITLSREGGRVELRAEAAMPAPRPEMVVQLVTYRPREDVEISRGENAGRTVTYSNIVTAWHRVGEWNGEAAFEAALEPVGSGPVAVIVQESGPGAVLGAARLD